MAMLLRQAIASAIVIRLAPASQFIYCIGRLYHFVNEGLPKQIFRFVLIKIERVA
jgi:hypothetical protein